MASEPVAAPPNPASDAEPRTTRIKLVIAYDGAAYAGWQWQKNALSAQERLEQAIERLTGHFVRLHGSSRTDSGVHALGMVAHGDFVDLKIPIHRMALALNALLPEDLRVQSATEVPPSFHARFHALGKEYRYIVWNARANNPLLRGLAWHVPGLLDIDPIRRAAPRFVGTKDFRSFANVHSYAIEDTVRTVTDVRVRRAGPQITFVIRGEGFLYRMCRTIVGTLIDVGLGKFSAEDIDTMLAKENRSEAGQCAPAHGLTLWQVFYPIEFEPLAEN